jgi:peptidoglycan hydrolase-like protein with peptidoglycan-binding domain
MDTNRTSHVAATRNAQRRLITLHYLLAGDDDGRFGPTTSEAILAFQKLERLERTGVLDASTRARLRTATEPTPVTRGGPGKRAEVLLDRQVALLIDDNRVVRAIAVSTGKPSTPTPPGSYRVYAKIPRCARLRASVVRRRTLDVRLRGDRNAGQRHRAIVMLRPFGA